MARSSTTARERLESRDEACRLLGDVSYQTLWRIVRVGGLTPVEVGRRTMFRRSELDALIATGRISTQQNEKA
jgi:excisionase family DNA binding protein